MASCKAVGGLLPQPGIFGLGSVGTGVANGSVFKS
jgi:hypothetical protein